MPASSASLSGTPSGSGSGTTTTTTTTAAPSGNGATIRDGYSFAPAATTSSYLANPAASGNILDVCPSGCTFSLPSAAIAAAVDGDTVQITGGDYVDCATLNANNLTVRGISVSGVRPHLHDKVCSRKGIFVTEGSHILIDNLEFSNMIDDPVNGQDQNWAGVRVDAGSEMIIVRNSYFHDGNEGILTGADSNNIVLVDTSFFERIGQCCTNGQSPAHGMYMGVIGQFILHNSVVISGQNQGHEVKTRAWNSLIECNVIASLDGVDSYSLDMPVGGVEVLRSNVIQQGTQTSNPNLIAMGEESSSTPLTSSLQLTNNILINDAGSNATFLWINQSPTIGSWSGNTAVGAGTLLLGIVYPGGITQIADRTTAGLTAYDGTLASLPVPPVCPP